MVPLLPMPSFCPLYHAARVALAAGRRRAWQAGARWEHTVPIRKASAPRTRVATAATAATIRPVAERQEPGSAAEDMTERRAIPERSSPAGAQRPSSDPGASTAAPAPPLVTNYGVQKLAKMCKDGAWGAALARFQQIERTQAVLPSAAVVKLLKLCLDQGGEAESLAVHLVRSPASDISQAGDFIATHLCRLCPASPAHLVAMVEGLREHGLALTPQQHTTAILHCASRPSPEGSEAAVVLAGFMHRAGQLPDGPAMAALITRCVEEGHGPAAWALLRASAAGEWSLPFVGAEATEALVASLASSTTDSSSRGAMALALALRGAGREVGRPVWQALLRACGAKGRLVEALAMLRRLGALGGAADEDIHTALLQYEGSVADVAAVKAVLAEVSASSHSSSSSGTADLPAKAAASHDAAKPQHAQEPVRSSKARSSSPPAHLKPLISEIEACVPTYNNTRLKRALWRSGSRVASAQAVEEVMRRLLAQGRQIQACLWLFKKMRVTNLPRSRQAYMMAMRAAAGLGRTIQSGRLLREMEEQDGKPVDADVLHDILMQAVLNQQVSVAEYFFHLMRSRGLLPSLSASECAVLLTLLTENDAWRPATELLMAMRELSGLKQQQLSSEPARVPVREDLRPTVPQWGQVIRACASQDGKADLTLLLLLVMKRDGLRPTPANYLQAMRACAAQGQGEQAAYLQHDLRQTCKDAGDDTLATSCLWVMHAHAKAARLLETEQAFEEMLAMGFPPTVGHYTVLVDACGKEGAEGGGEKALRWLRHMDERGVRGNAALHTAAVVALARAGMWDEAYRYGMGQGAKPMRMLIDSLAKGGLWPLACYVYDTVVVDKLLAAADSSSPDDPVSGLGPDFTVLDDLNTLICSLPHEVLRLLGLSYYRQAYEAGLVTPWTRGPPVMLDLHYFSRPLARLALKCILDDVWASATEAGGKGDEEAQRRRHVHSLKDKLVVVTGRGDAGVLRQEVRAIIEKHIGLRVEDAVGDTKYVVNKGRLEVPQQSLYEWAVTRR